MTPLASNGLLLVLLLGLVTRPPLGKVVTLVPVSTEPFRCGPEYLPISITRNGQVRLDDERLRDVAILRQRLKAKRVSPLIIADAELPYGAVRRVIAATGATHF